MGKYEASTKCILNVFGTPEWKAEGIKTYPNNFIGVDTGNRYIRVHVLPQGAGLNLKSASGQVIVDIFTPAGGGPMDAVEIADRLDAYLVGKSRSLPEGTTQFGNSALQHLGSDKANPALHRSSYVISFNYFGV